MLGGFYTLKQPILGASYTVAAVLPYVWMSVTGECRRGSGPSASATAYPGSTT